MRNTDRRRDRIAVAYTMLACKAAGKNYSFVQTILRCRCVTCMGTAISVYTARTIGLALLGLFYYTASSKIFII